MKSLSNKELELNKCNCVEIFGESDKIYYCTYMMNSILLDRGIPYVLQKSYLTRNLANRCKCIGKRCLHYKTSNSDILKV